jgi:nucleoside-diphosphate-sugar epimerase
VRSLIEVVEGDIRDRASVDRAVTGCDLVYHVAALYRDTSASSRAYWEVNVGGTEHVLAACERHRVRRLVHCSTIGVHGSITRIPSDETAPIRPTDAYQRSKAAGEERVWAWFKRTGIPTSVVRPAGIYGPGDLRFLKLFRSIQRGHFVMLGPGTTQFHMSYIDNLVQGYLRYGTLDAAVGEAFIIADERHVALNDLVARVAQTVGGEAPRWRLPVWPFYAAGALCEVACVPFGIQPPLHRRRVGFFTHERAFSIAKAQRVLGYAPTVNLDEGLRRTADWYRTHGYLRPTNGHVGAPR